MFRIASPPNFRLQFAALASEPPPGMQGAFVNDAKLLPTTQSRNERKTDGI